MKTKYLLLGAIFAVFGLTAHAQMYEMYYQGFESGETVNYSGTPSANVRYSSNIYSGGSRALKLVQTTTTDGTVQLPQLPSAVYAVQVNAKGRSMGSTLIRL